MLLRDYWVCAISFSILFNYLRCGGSDLDLDYSLYPSSFFFLSFYVAPPLSFVFPSHTHKKKRLDTILWVISDSDLLSMPIPNRLDTKRIYGLFVFAFRRFPLMHVALCFFQIVLRLMLSLWVMNLRQKMKSTGSCILTRGKDWIVDMQQETHSSFPSHYE